MTEVVRPIFLTSPPEQNELAGAGQHDDPDFGVVPEASQDALNTPQASPR